MKEGYEGVMISGLMLLSVWVLIAITKPLF